MQSRIGMQHYITGPADRPIVRTAQAIPDFTVYTVVSRAAPR
jgi:hypothetical protein